MIGGLCLANSLDLARRAWLDILFSTHAYDNPSADNILGSFLKALL